MSWTYITAGGSSSDATTATTQAVASLGTIAAGDVVVVAFKWEGTDTTITCSDGTSSFTQWSLGTQQTASGEPFLKVFYLNGSVATGTVSYTCTLSSGRPWRTMVVMVYRPSAAAVLDGTPSAGSGVSGTALSSGNTTTTGTDGVAFGAYATYGATLSSMQINGGAAEHTQVSTGDSSQLWSKTYTSGFTGAATATLNVSERWVAGILAFKISAGGGGALPHLYYARHRAA